MREERPFQRHRTVRRQRVGVEEDAWLTAQFVHLVKHILVLQTVVLVEVPLAVTFAWCSNLLIVGEFGQSFQQLAAEGDAAEEISRHSILGLHPSGSLCRGVVLQPTVGVGHLRTKIFVYCAVLGGLRILQALCLHHGCGYDCHTH